MSHTSMSFRSSGLVVWTPRVLGILVALFIGAFALDAVGEGLGPFLIHLTPAVLLALIVVLAWRWAWIGALAFIGLAVLYAANTLNRPDWIAVISGPLLLVGLLFLWSWRARSG